MKKKIVPVIVLLLFSAVLRADDFTAETECRKSSTFLAPIDSSDYRKYAPSREIDILHLAIDVTPDFTNRSVAGKTTLTFKPIAMPFEELRLDAIDLSVSNVTSSEKILEYHVTDQQIIVTFANPIPPDKEAWVTVEHRAEPRNGMYFRTPELGYKAGDTHLFTQGEQTEARYWFPCFDSPNEKFTSDVTCRVPEGMTVISNGRLVSQEKDSAGGLIAVKWSQDKPHVSYLITLVAGYFKKIEDKHKDIPLAFYTPPSQIEQAMNSFRDTKDMMAFFEQETGFPYPWAKYDQIVVDDFVAGGMENTSATTLTDTTLFTDATENLRSSEGLVAHELAHQWFGDLVTCKDWSHIWLNEGAATYYETLYREHKHGRDDMLYELYGRARDIANRANDTNAIVRRTYNDPGELFSYLAYDKGSWVLHMLRSQLGPELYRRCIRTYLERHQYGSVVSDNLRAVVEELSGRSFDQFFDQWLYHGHHPELDVNYSWDARSKLAKLTFRQTQKIGDGVLLFNFPLTIRFKAKSGDTDKQIVVKEKSEDFFFALDEAPTIVRVDPDYTLLAKTTFNPPTPMLHAQLEDKGDVMGRLLAVEALSQKRDKESVAKLKQALNNDEFYGVRLEAAKALRVIHTEDALDALVASTNQADARVRVAVFRALAGFYDPKVFAAQTAMLAREKNPEIQGEGIRELGAYSKSEVREKLLGYLNSQSYRSELAEDAIAAIRRQDDPSYIEPLRENLKARQSDYRSWGFARGLDTLAYLARAEENKDAVREFLLGYVSHPRRNIQIGAINALGTLQDARAIPVLQKFALARRRTSEQIAAESAIRKIEDARKPVEGLSELRREFLDLQKENRKLRDDIEALEKKVNAATAKPTAPQPETKKKPNRLKAPKEKSGR